MSRCAMSRECCILDVLCLDARATVCRPVRIDSRMVKNEPAADSQLGVPVCTEFADCHRNVVMAFRAASQREWVGESIILLGVFFSGARPTSRAGISRLWRGPRVGCSGCGRNHEKSSTS